MADKCLFLVFSPEEHKLQQIKSDISSTDGHVVETVKTAQAVSQRLAKGDVNCLVFNSKHFDSNSVKLLNMLRETRKQMAVIVFAGSVAKDIYTYTNTNKLKRVVIIELPYNQEDLELICGKIAKGQEVYQRQHGRFATNQAIVIDRLPHGERLRGIMHNMSLGGAYLEVQGSVEENDTLKITLQLDAGASEFVYGEVVRIERGTFGPGKNGVGVRFISPEGLYNALLAKLEIKK